MDKTSSKKKMIMRVTYLYVSVGRITEIMSPTFLGDLKLS